MPQRRTYRESNPGQPPNRRESRDSWEEKRRRFADNRGGSRASGGPSPTTLLTIGGLFLGIAFVVAMTFAGNSSPGATAVSAVQQIPAATGATESGKVSISVQEVAEKKLVYWDYQQGNTKVPLLAYATPSGALKLAARLCEPCNGYSFRVEGTNLVCNTCGTRWDLETSKGISGGCLEYPPEVLPSTLADGKLSADEAKIASWKPRA